MRWFPEALLAPRIRRPEPVCRSCWWAAEAARPRSPAKVPRHSHSSGGTGRLALQIGTKRQKAFLGALGMFDPIGAMKVLTEHGRRAKAEQDLEHLARNIAYTMLHVRASGRPWPEVDAIESNLLALSCLELNARQSGLDSRVFAHAHDGPLEHGGPYDLALVNPPTHADEATSRSLLAPLAEQMRPEAPAFFVVSRPGRFPDLLRSLGARVRAWQSDRYTVFGAKWSR